jgi:phosphopantothenoylcysteine synthetase/decarboxylase
MLANRVIVLGVTGSIAAFKAADLASKLTQERALVDVVMTEAFRHAAHHAQHHPPACLRQHVRPEF